MFTEFDKFIVVDTETTNSIDDPLCYDVGFAVVDKFGKVYEKHSYVVSDIFLDKELMSSAYFADKIPQYWEEIKHGDRYLRTFAFIKRKFAKVCKAHGVKIILAHNARFDYRSLNLTLRFLTSSKDRFFFPYGSIFVDTLQMSRIVLKNNIDYDNFCYTNNYLTKRLCKRYTAEIIYRFISKNNNFIESHTGLEDVLIEKEIFVFCYRENPKSLKPMWDNQVILD